jgi:hypothetical protein
MGHPIRRTQAAPWLKDALWTRARVVPSLDLRFADNKSLVDSVSGQNLITFTRASSATYIDSTGTLQTASTDVPRFDHNPTTGESLGLLVEEQRTNLLPRSEEFDNASWVKVGSTVTANAGAAPDGATTADLLTRTTTGVSYATQTLTKAASIQYTWSVFVKQSAGNFCALRLQGTYPSRVDVVFNLSSSTISATATVFGNFTGPSASITPYVNGWYRLAVTATTDATTTAQVLVSFNSNGAVADGSDSVSTSAGLLWGAQLEAGSFPTSYIPTTTAAATRAADVATITGTAFSSWYRQDEGTIYFSAKTKFAVPSGAFPRVFQVQAASSADKIEQSFYSGGQVCLVRTTAAIEAEWYPNYFIQNGVTSSFAVATNNTAGSSNGVITGTDSVVVLPTVDRMQIGSENTSINHLNGTIRRLTYFPARLPNTTLQRLTQ